MSLRTTNLGPRVSLTTTLADAGPQHLFLDSNTTFTAAGTNTITGAVTLSGTAAFSGAVTMTSTLTAGGTNTFSSGIGVGGGTNVATISTITGDVDLASVPGHDSISSTVAFVGVAVGDAIMVHPSSEWSGAYYDLNLSAHATAADVITLIASNSAVTAVNAADVVMRFTALTYAAF